MSDSGIDNPYGDDDQYAEPVWDGLVEPTPGERVYWEHLWSSAETGPEGDKLEMRSGVVTEAYPDSVYVDIGDGEKTAVMRSWLVPICRECGEPANAHDSPHRSVEQMSLSTTLDAHAKDLLREVCELRDDTRDSAVMERLLLERVRAYGYDVSTFDGALKVVEFLDANHECDRDDGPCTMCGVCGACGGEGTVSEDAHSYGRSEGHYTIDRPCPVCGPEEDDGPDPEDE
jgi:hypothetical protein